MVIALVVVVITILVQRQAMVVVELFRHVEATNLPLGVNLELLIVIRHLLIMLFVA
jgi:hypothetical protein